MNLRKLNSFDLSDDFNLKTVAQIEELMFHDMIYVYHHINIGTEIKLLASGSNVKGDIRYEVCFKNFTLGFVTLGGFFKNYYEQNEVLFGRIKSYHKKKFMPIQDIDIEIDIVKLKNVS